MRVITVVMFSAALFFTCMALLGSVCFLYS